MSVSYPLTDLLIGERENFGFEGDTEGTEDTDWYVLGEKRTCGQWPFLNWAPGHIIT